jgi:glycosyltransferase involved in cell wall biosynthesis
MPRLLILCEFPTLLGGERSMLATLPAVTAAGFELHVAAPACGPLAEAISEHGVAHFPWQTRNADGTRRGLGEIRAELAGICQRLKPAIVHANSLSTSRIAGPVTVTFEIPSIGHLRDILKLSPQVVRDLNAHRRLVAVSQATRDFHVAQGIEPAKCEVIYNGIDLNEWRPRQSTGYLHRALKLPPSARLIAVIGQLGIRKGTDIALVAAGRVATHVPDAHWLIAGERTSDKTESRMFEVHLHTFATSPTLKDRVHLLGARSDIAELMSECDLLVHAARQEPLGRVLLEAAACGLAIVATDVGGTREIFPTESNCAAIVPPNDSLVIADAVLSLLRDEASRRALGEAARRRVEQAFNFRNTAPRLIEQYQEILS